MLKSQSLEKEHMDVLEQLRQTSAAQAETKLELEKRMEQQTQAYDEQIQ